MSERCKRTSEWMSKWPSVYAQILVVLHHSEIEEGKTRNAGNRKPTTGLECHHLHSAVFGTDINISNPMGDYERLFRVMGRTREKRAGERRQEHDMGIGKGEWWREDGFGYQRKGRGRQDEGSNERQERGTGDREQEKNRQVGRQVDRKESAQEGRNGGQEGERKRAKLRKGKK